MVRFASILRGRRGLALPSAMFALVAVSLLVVGLFVVSDLSARATRNRERATRAMQLAEAGVAHLVAVSRNELRVFRMGRLLAGFDSLANTPDDSLVVNYPQLPIGDWIPDSGRAVTGGRYYVHLLDDPADPRPGNFVDGNERMVVRCRGLTNDGAEAEIDAIVGATPMPGVATNGNLNVPGNPQILGGCGSMHSNATLNLNGSSTVAEFVSAVNQVNGGAQLPDGQPAPEYPNAPPVPIPTLNPADYCANADYRLRADGYIVVVATGQVFDASSNEVFGWRRSSDNPVKWDLAGDNSVPGTVCVEGNVTVGGNTGTAANPQEMSIIATGSIEIGGNPYLTTADPDNIQFLAGGDLKISGNPTIGTNNFEGLMYAGSQCQVSGNPTLNGQLLCDNRSNPAGAINHFNINEISGNPSISYSCNWNVFNKRRVLTWYQRYGS